jgi:hypothetical protein
MKSIIKNIFVSRKKVCDLSKYMKGITFCKGVTESQNNSNKVKRNHPQVTNPTPCHASKETFFFIFSRRNFWNRKWILNELFMESNKS